MKKRIIVYKMTYRIQNGTARRSTAHAIFLQLPKEQASGSGLVFSLFMAKVFDYVIIPFFLAQLATFKPIKIILE